MVRQGLLLNLELVRLTGQQSPAILVSLLPQCGLLQACAPYLASYMDARTKHGFRLAEQVLICTVSPPILLVLPTGPEACCCWLSLVLGLGLLHVR